MTRGFSSAVVLLVGLVWGQTPPTAKPAPPSAARGNAAAGREVFRFETFGNEGFWTDAMRMPTGVLDAKLTPLQALDAGLLVDIEALDPAMRDALGKELRTDRSPANAPMLNDVKTTVKLIEAKAVVGLVAKDSNGDGRIDPGVKGFPFVKATMNDKIGVPDSLVGRRVDEQKLRDLKWASLVRMTPQCCNGPHSCAQATCRSALQPQANVVPIRGD